MTLEEQRKTRNPFGATAPPYIDYLKDILRRYPDGGQILKELIQNADDAEASEVIFIHDERSYGKESLWSDNLGKYQGPALYAYNNAAFTDDDWRGIQATGRSVKRDDPNKVGRFGIGFNSVYHITDVPCIFSSGYLGLLDPQEKLFGKGTGGYQWSLADAEDRDLLMKLHDQFQPFQDIVTQVGKQNWTKVITEDQHFAGTLFRFPLRNEPSEISDNLYDSDRVVQLFDSFIADADISLLFLKHVKSVSLIHINTDNSVNVRLKVTCSGPTDVVPESGDAAIIEGSTGFKIITSTSDDHKDTKKWLVTTCCMKEGHLDELDSLAKKLCFNPQVDLAFPCGPERDHTGGRLSCFLPLPNNDANKTGLPVYVNACFGLTDNRRNIKWQEEDQKHDEAAMWNELLVKDVVPLAYLRILQDAIKLSRESSLPVSSVYRLWPNITQIQHKDKWHAVALEVLQQLFLQDVASLSLAADERQFVSPSEAVFPCTDATSSVIGTAISRTLVSFGVKLVTFPDSVARAIRYVVPQLYTERQVTPAFMRPVLHGNTLDNISEQDRLCLLEYILSDRKYQELQDLQLLPLSDGTFRCFSDREEDVALIDSDTFPRVLLPGCKNLFIPDDLSTPCLTHLKELATMDVFRIFNIDSNRVAEYAKRYLPKGWEETKTRHVTWEVGSSQHPPVKWLQEFWKFLNIHFKELSGFTGMPLIPIEPLQEVNHPVLLARLQQNTTLILQKNKQTTLPDPISQVVKKVGGIIVKGDECLKHQDLESYVLPPSPRSVMQVLANLDSQHVISEIKTTASHTQKEDLKDYLSSLGSLSNREKDILSKLPLFLSMNGSCVPAHSKQAVLLSSGLAIPAELPVPDSLIQCATEADRRLLQLLNVPLVDTAHVASLLIAGLERGDFERKDKQKIMIWILTQGKILFSQNTTLKRRCKDLSFIESNGELKKASTFFDPRNETFRVLFEELFPPPVYTQTPQMLESLTDLGLLNKDMDVTPSHVLHAAAQIENLHVHSQQEAVKRFEVLLRLLDATDLLTRFSGQQLEHLRGLQWIPCVEPDDKGKQSEEDSQRRSFFCPNEIRHATYKDIVGHVMPLTGELSESVSCKLGLRRFPSPAKVVDNLSVLKSMAQTMRDPDMNVDFKRKLHSIYKCMQDHIPDFSKVMKKDTCWLWTHNQFVCPQELVLDYPLNLELASYIRKVPEEFLPYKKLLLGFGLRPRLSEEEVVGILHDIKQNIEKKQPPFGNASELKVSIAILNWLWREKKTVGDDILVPVMAESEQFNLKPLSTTVFCDISRDGLEDLKHDQEEFHIIHEEIPRATTEWLNVPLLSTRILSPELVGIEQCGQFEPITMRIKNILKEYDEENDIFKELLQNAEDAGAKTCRFMVDLRIHKDPPESLIDPGMALCQGPCLWAFNDELFSEDDWGNIVRVGSASKENMVEKIGKFGLGFNTVYHITDVPTILSGHKLLILDPNVTHLTKHIKGKTNPGIKLDLSRQRLLNRFPGQFKPYERIFDCNFTRESGPKPYYPGTLIKLPFRTQEEALMSEISTNVFSIKNINTFQQQFISNSQTHLLFLKNINTLSLQKITGDASTPPRDDQIGTLFTVSRTTESSRKVPDDSYLLRQSQSDQMMKLGEKCKEVIDCNTVSIAKITQQHCSPDVHVQYWLLHNCFGTRQSLKMSLEKNKQAKFSLPIGGIAVPLHFNPETKRWAPSQTKLVGQAFCFLPLSIHTGLPVNVNGAFDVTSNRKGLWETGVRHEWNKALLQDPGMTAYITVLSVLKDMSEHKILESYHYHTFWPYREEVCDTFKPLVDAFYSAIAQHSDRPVELFSDGSNWCSLDKAIFLHQSIEDDKNVGTLAMEVCHRHAKAPNHVVPLPLRVRNSFKQAGLETVLQSRTWDWETFYQEVVFSNLTTMDPESRDALVLHAIDLNMSAVDSLLTCNPCIPTQSGQLQYINKLVDPNGKVACLFGPEEDRLLGGTKNDFCSPKRIQRLLELGMLSDSHFPLEDVTERAGRMASVWAKDTEKAYGHLRCILELMRSSLQEEDDSPWWEALRETVFIPAFSSGQQNNGMVTLWKPTEVYSDTCRLLVNMTQPVVDNSNMKIHNADPILQILGIRERPPLETVLQQLEDTSRQSQPCINKTMLYKIAHECYSFLNQWLQNSEDSELIANRAHSFPFILVGDKFEDVKYVAENEEFEAKPYLHVLPTVFSGFKELWKCAGVKKNFTSNQLITVLKELHALHRNNPLPKSDLKVCLTILNNINKGPSEAREDEKRSDCLVPSERGVLQPASKLHYNDSPWMPVPSGITLCHEDIPRKMACNFGIETTRHQSLENYSVENSSPFAFEFEQHEELTVRIKNIIAAYPSKKDILKELIQNADDAEATEIHFVLDKRQHGTKKTFGKRWNQLQGPALCVYNNKVFSDADRKGIQQLGEGGKHNATGKTGKYGLGFNSVYHLTDCPSILTGDQLLCISDPNRKYIECTSGKPHAGIGYELAKDFKDMYMDVYKSFLPDGFPLEEGTMFRLPLRMGALANSSKISTQGVTDRDMEELSSALSEDPEGLILFLKNIRKIQFHEIDAHSDELNTIFKVEKGLTETSGEKRDSFQKHLQNALQSDKPITPTQAIYDIKISTSDKRQSNWTIAEQFGSFKNSTGTESYQSDKVPHAALAACMSCKPSTAFIGRAFCSLPLPGPETALPVHVNGNFEVDSSRRALWKEDGHSPKANWNESLKQNIIAPLYADFLQHIRCNIAKIKVCSVHDDDSRFDDGYLCFFPIVSKDVAQEWHEMVHNVYRSIDERALDVIPVWRSSTKHILQFTEFSFDWCNVQKTDLTNTPYLTDRCVESEGVNAILEDLGMRLVPSYTKMAKIWTSFKTAGVEVKSVSPSTVGHFLREKPLNDSTKTELGLPLPINQTLIKDGARCSKLLNYCLHNSKGKTIPKDKSCSVNGLPLLLTKDQVLRVFNTNSPKLISRYEWLFFDHEEDFADYLTNMWHVDILQEGKFLNKLTIPTAEKHLKRLLQHLLQDCELDPLCGLQVPNEMLQKWLKVLWKFFLSEVQPAASVDGDSEPTMSLSAIKDLFSDCCLLPVVCPRLKGRRFLETMEHMPSVINCGSKEDISKILFKLGFMKLDISFFTEIHAQERSLLHPNLLDIRDISTVLANVYKLNHSEFCKLSKDNLKKLQSVLQDGMSTSKDKQEYQRKLKSLPLFETVQGEHVPISGHQNVFILKTNSMAVFPDLFTHHANRVVLKDTYENQWLSDHMNIRRLTDVDYFVMFIVPILCQLTEEQIIRSIELLLSLKYNSDYNKHHEQIIMLMKPVNLIRSAHGNLEQASFYFDDSVELYKAMVPQEKFVPKAFWDRFPHENGTNTKAHAKELLETLGMKHVVSTDEIIDFAVQIEREAKGDCAIEELKNKSSKLWKTTLTLGGDKKRDLLKRMCNIKFLFPMEIRQELRDYHQPFATERTTVAIRGSLIHNDQKHQDLVWTSMPIIALPGVATTQFHTGKDMETVGALAQPPQECVIRNMSNICQLPCQTPGLKETRAKVLRGSYAFLQSLTEFEGDLLTNLPVVLVEKDTKLVKAAETVLGLPIGDLELRPYLYNIPPNDVMYAEFFRKIGVRQEPTVQQYCNVLTAIYVDSVDKQTLHANQQTTVKRAVQQLFLLIKAHRGQTSTLELPTTLHLPSVDGMLYPSNTLYFNDTVFQTSRLEGALDNKLQLLQKLSICYLGNDIYEHHRLLKLLPQNVQPKMLSLCTVEKVVESRMQLCEYGKDCKFIGWFDKHLTSMPFRHGLICLIREQSAGEINQEDADEMCQRTVLSSIEITCCKSLETELWLDERPLDDTGVETDVYVKKEQQGCTFYLKHHDDTASKVISEINLTLTEEINALLDNKLGSNLLPVLGHLLVCDSLEDVEKILSKKGIRNCAATEDLLRHPPVPGTAVPEEWHDSLDMNFLNNFEEGEYVGYENAPDAGYIYAVVIEHLPGTYGPYSGRYKIQIGQDEVIEVSSLDMYQFKQDTKLRQGTRCPVSVEGSTELEAQAGSVPRTPQTSARSSPESLEEAKKEIDKCLAAIWTLPEKERLKAIKRLYLRWHPDKNLDCKQLATEAFKYLKNRVDDPMQGKPSSSQEWNTNSRDFYETWTTHSGGFYERWDQEAKRHRRGRERFHSSYHSRGYNFWRHYGNVPHPDREEAQRWCRQARCDLTAAYKDTGGGSTEWCLFKVHQAVEKALMAAEFKKHGKHPDDSSISLLAARVSRYNSQLNTLPQIVDQLVLLGVDAKKTQYPNCHPSPHIPNGQFKSDNEEQVLQQASELLTRVEVYVN